jgi:hypothetical protein
MLRAASLVATLMLSTLLPSCVIDDADEAMAPELSEVASAYTVQCPWFPHTEYHRMAPGDEMACPTWAFGTTLVSLKNDSGGTILVNLQAGAWSQLVSVPRLATQPIVRIFAGVGVKITHLAPMGVVLQVKVH